MELGILRCEKNLNIIEVPQVFRVLCLLYIDVIEKDDLNLRQY